MTEAIEKLESMLEWSDRLGSDEKHEIESIIKSLKNSDVATLEEIRISWKESYGEDMKTKYSGFWQKLKKLKFKRL